jgi:hypothetical protein
MAKRNKTCFSCDKNIKLDEKYFMVAIEVPYINLYFCWDCRESIDINEFIRENAEKISQYDTNM